MGCGSFQRRDAEARSGNCKLKIVRKPILIAVALLTLTAVGYFLVSPRRLVEYHKKRYLDAFHEREWTERVRTTWVKVTGFPLNSQAQARRYNARLDYHERALIELGYLEQQRFDVFGQTPERVMARLVGQFAVSPIGCFKPRMARNFRFVTNHHEIDEIVRIGTEPDFGVVVIAPRRNMTKWAELVRRADWVDTAIK